MGPSLRSRGGIVPGAGVRGSGGEMMPSVRSGVGPGVNTVKAVTFSCRDLPPLFLSSVPMKRT